MMATSIFFFFGLEMKKYSYDAVQEGLPKNGFQIMGEIQPKTTGQTQVY